MFEPTPTLPAACDVIGIVRARRDGTQDQAVRETS